MALTSAGVRKVIRRACKAEGSQKAWAAKHGISQAYLSDVLLGRREPSPAILRPLGLERATVYRKIKASGA